MELLERLTAPGPKRILALDGGGMRGLITLGILERIEAILRERHGDPQMRLCDYFDLIGGASTGAVIAASLAMGLTAAEVREMYVEFGSVAFAKRRWQFWKSRFDAGPLEQQLTRILGDRTLGDPDLRTGLCIITKRADTGSTWRLFNHPNGRYFKDNRDILVRHAVRASVAMPFFYTPTQFEVKAGQIGAFVDGGVSMANNPGLEMFLVATLKGFPFKWQTGAEQLMLVSVGTGSWSNREKPGDVTGGSALKGVRRTVRMLLNDADWQGQLLLQALSDTPTPQRIDREIGDLSDDRIGAEAALHYLRYNLLMEPEDLEALGLKRLSGRLARIRDPFAAREKTTLAEIGEVVAQARVKPEHFLPAFDIRPAMASSTTVASSFTKERIAAVAATVDPALRNLKITWFYHEAADEMSRLIGSRDVTWFGFGARASKTVGRIIRYEVVPTWLREPATRASANPFLAPIGSFLFHERKLMAEGNLLVFEELAPLAAAFLERFGSGERDDDALEAFIAALRPGPPQAAGQDLLGISFRAWYEAVHEPDPAAKAQLVLLGNCNAVHHEQQRLQPLLLRSLEVPIVDPFFQRAASARFVGPVVRRGRPLGLMGRRLWQRTATNTRAFAAYDLPETALGLGEDVRGPAPGIDFPPALRILSEQRLMALLESLGAPLSATRGSASDNWADLGERMRFIATVFRSRQQDLGLLAPPFTRSQVEAFEEGKLPRGRL